MVAVVILTLVAIALGPSVAAGQTPQEPLPERFTIAISAGVQVFDCKEEFEGGHSEYTSIGPRPLHPGRRGDDVASRPA